MNIFNQIVKHRERFIDMQRYCPDAVYLGIDEALALDKLAEYNLPRDLDVANNQRDRIIGMDIYVVDAVSHMVMI